MFFLVLFGLLVVLLTFLLHYVQHFRFHLCTPKRSQPSNVAYTNNKIHAKTTIVPIHISSQNKKSHPKCTCNIHLTSIDDEDFDFLPFSFFFYCIFIIFLYTILISKWIINSDGIVSYILDYMLIYGIMILSIWESLFSFYRYYTTKILTKTCNLVSTTRVLTRFTIYMIVFIIVFNIQIHFEFHWIFPIIIIVLYSIFNIYCNLVFASILIARYMHFLDMNEFVDNNDNINKEILNSVYFMKRISLISNILSTSYLSIFLYFHSINITYYYLPILWSISCFTFCLNFIRNYNCIQQQIVIKCKRCICICCNYSDSKIIEMISSNDTSTQTPTIEIRDGEDIKQNDIDIIFEKEEKTNYDRFNELIQSLPSNDGLNARSYSVNNVHQEELNKNDANKLHQKSISATIKRNKSDLDNKIDDDNDDNDDDNNNMSKRIAFSLLYSNTNPKTRNLRLGTQTNTKMVGLKPSYSMNDAIINGNYYKSKSHDDENDTTPIPMDFDGNKMYDSIENKFEKPKKEYLELIPLKRESVSYPVCMFKKSALRNVVSVHVTKSNVINGSHLKMPGLKHKANESSESGIVYIEDYDDDNNDDNIDQEWKDNNDTNNNNAGFENNDNKENKKEKRDLNEIMMPLCLMAKHGLISKKSINSVHRYHHQRPHSILQRINTDITCKAKLKNLEFPAKQCTL